MSYRCPLCLKELKNEKLVRYCYSCNQAVEISGNTENLARNLKCQKRGCASNQRIVEGIYIYHLGCRAANPLWQRNNPDNENDWSGTLEVPADLDGKSFTIPGKGSFTHWQIGVLGKTARHQAGASDGSMPQKSASQLSEMWFPSMLLRMTAEKRPNFANKKIGQIVGLVGIKNAGKTILALQALDREGYIASNSNREIRLEDYIYSFPREIAVTQPFFELLQLRSLMRANKPFEMPSGTLRASTNLYTVFFHPTQLALKKKEKPQQEADANPTGWWQRVKKVWEEGIGYLPASETFLFTLAFYDIAGEDYEKRVELVQDLENKVDKIALVIDGTDLVGGNRDSEKNLADCVECLELLKRREKPFCVVLTKMDMFFKQAIAREPGIADQINPRHSAFYRGDQNEIKDFLKNWRDVSLLFDIKPYPHNLENFLKMLTSADGDFPIFFVETVNLPPPPDKEVLEQPITFGLDTFVCWSLDVEAEEIIENP